PELLCARRKRSPRLLGAIASFVVLPFVAEITAEPSGNLAARRSTAPGSSFQINFPGTVVPPPVRARRDNRPAARATAISAASGIETRKAGRGYRAAPIPRRGELRGALPQKGEVRHPGATYGAVRQLRRERRFMRTGGHRRDVRASADRKSTRLNSSHVATS